MPVQVSQAQLNSITLWYLVQHSLTAFYKLNDYFGNPEQALRHSHEWQSIGLHQSHLKRLKEFQTSEGQKLFQKVLHQLQQDSDFIICEHEALYPSQLNPYSDRPPILFGQGQIQALSEPQIAIVGSRKPSAHGQQIAYDFASYLAEKGFWITSGLAHGIDAAAHQAGLSHQRTIAVMATGLDLTYPTSHRHLRENILAAQGVIITEFLPFTKPLQHHFPRRNRLVSALSLGVLVAEAALSSGSLITAQLGAEQGKLIFAIPGNIYQESYKGCHQLIREGAILVDHPEQIIEDLALPATWQKDLPSSTTLALPNHLNDVYQALDWEGKSLDALAIGLNLDSAHLTAQLMELELYGLCIQQSGLYLRCGSGSQYSL